MRPIHLRPLLILPCLLLLFSCIGLWGKRTAHLPEWVEENDSPRAVAVLPFENLTPEPDIELLVRKSFYSHFAPKNYRDIELNEVDRALQILQKNFGKGWKDLSPEVLGNFFQADLLVYGKVLEYSKFYAGVYSQVALKVQIEIVECKSGSGVWWKTVMERSHDGGIPLSFFGIIPEAVRSGIHMNMERTLDLIERLSREIVAEIPDSPISDSSPYFLDVQIGSFLEKDLAAKAKEELIIKGYHPRVESVKIGDRLYHRVLLGPYRGTAEAEDAKSSVSREFGTRPILIHHRTPEKGTESTPEDDAKATVHGG